MMSHTHSPDWPRRDETTQAYVSLESSMMDSRDGGACAAAAAAAPAREMSRREQRFDTPATQKQATLLPRRQRFLQQHSHADFFTAASSHGASATAGVVCGIRTSLPIIPALTAPAVPASEPPSPPSARPASARGKRPIRQSSPMPDTALVPSASQLLQQQQQSVYSAVSFGSANTSSKGLPTRLSRRLPACRNPSPGLPGRPPRTPLQSRGATPDKDFASFSSLMGDNKGRLLPYAGDNVAAGTFCQDAEHAQQPLERGHAAEMAADIPSPHAWSNAVESAAAVKRAAAAAAAAMTAPPRQRSLDETPAVPEVLSGSTYVMSVERDTRRSLLGGVAPLQQAEEQPVAVETHARRSVYLAGSRVSATTLHPTHQVASRSSVHQVPDALVSVEKGAVTELGTGEEPATRGSIHGGGSQLCEAPEEPAVGQKLSRRSIRLTPQRELHADHNDGTQHETMFHSSRHVASRPSIHPVAFEVRTERTHELPHEQHPVRRSIHGGVGGVPLQEAEEGPAVVDRQSRHSIYMVTGGDENTAHRRKSFHRRRSVTSRASVNPVHGVRVSVKVQTLESVDLPADKSVSRTRVNPDSSDMGGAADTASDSRQVSTAASSERVQSSQALPWSLESSVAQRRHHSLHGTQQEPAQVPVQPTTNKCTSPSLHAFLTPDHSSYTDDASETSSADAVRNVAEGRHPVRKREDDGTSASASPTREPHQGQAQLYPSEYDPNNESEEEEEERRPAEASVSLHSSDEVEARRIRAFYAGATDDDDDDDADTDVDAREGRKRQQYRKIWHSSGNATPTGGEEWGNEVGDEEEETVSSTPEMTSEELKERLRTEALAAAAARNGPPEDVTTRRDTTMTAPPGLNSPNSLQSADRAGLRGGGDENEHEEGENGAYEEDEEEYEYVSCYDVSCQTSQFLLQGYPDTGPTPKPATPPAVPPAATHTEAVAATAEPPDPHYMSTNRWMCATGLCRVCHPTRSANVYNHIKPGVTASRSDSISNSRPGSNGRTAWPPMTESIFGHAASARLGHRPPQQQRQQRNASSAPPQSGRAVQLHQPYLTPLRPTTPSLLSSPPPPPQQRQHQQLPSVFSRSPPPHYRSHPPSSHSSARLCSREMLFAGVTAYQGEYCSTREREVKQRHQQRTLRKLQSAQHHPGRGCWEGPAYTPLLLTARALQPEAGSVEAVYRYCDLDSEMMMLHHTPGLRGWHANGDVPLKEYNDTLKGGPLITAPAGTLRIADHGEGDSTDLVASRSPSAHERADRVPAAASRLSTTRKKGSERPSAPGTPVLPAVAMAAAATAAAAPPVNRRTAARFRC